MAELKTQKNGSDVSAFLEKIDNEQKKKDCQELLKIFEEITGEKASMWGTSIVGFGSYHYQSTRSKQAGDWPLTGFSPRQQNITIYIMLGFSAYQDLLQKLGKYKTSVSCLYIKRLTDIDLQILKKLIEVSMADLRKKYPKT